MVIKLPYNTCKKVDCNYCNYLKECIIWINKK